MIGAGICVAVIANPTSRAPPTPSVTFGIGSRLLDLRPDRHIPKKARIASIEETPFCRS
jgi:hypothetical protein